MGERLLGFHTPLGKAITYISNTLVLIFYCIIPQCYFSDSWQLSEEDRLTVSRARKVERFLSQPFFVAKVFTGLEGEYVPVAETVESFEAIIDGRA